MSVTVSLSNLTKENEAFHVIELEGDEVGLNILVHLLHNMGFIVSVPNNTLNNTDHLQIENLNLINVKLQSFLVSPIGTIRELKHIDEIEDVTSEVAIDFLKQYAGQLGGAKIQDYLSNRFLVDFPKENTKITIDDFKEVLSDDETFLFEKVNQETFSSFEVEVIFNEAKTIKHENDYRLVFV